MDSILSHDEVVLFFSKLENKPENKTCFDCKAKGPVWASISFGVFICVNCSSIHRNMGTHVTFVRSIKLDRWKPSQLKYMELGGNQAARLYFEQHGGDKREVESKYLSTVGTNYKELLDSKVKKALQNTPIQNTFLQPNTPSPLSISTLNSSPSTATSSPMFTTTTTSTSNNSSINNSSNSFLQKSSSSSTISTPSTLSTTPNNNKTVVQKPLTEDDDFDSFFSSSPPKNTISKKVVAKKIDKKSFDDDWDSLPEKQEINNNNNNNNNSNNNKNKSSSFKFNNEYIENDNNSNDNDDDYNNRTQLSPELKSLYTSSKFSMDFSVDQPNSNKSKNQDSPPLYSQQQQQQQQQSKQQQTRQQNNNNRSPNNQSPNNQSPRNSNYQHQNETDYARKNFTNAKSISSSNYYGEDKDKIDPDKQQRISKFTNSKSISSAQYYERDESPSLKDMSASNIARQLAFHAKTDFSSISNSIIDGTKKIGNMINELQDRYN